MNSKAERSAVTNSQGAGWLALASAVGLGSFVLGNALLAESESDAQALRQWVAALVVFLLPFTQLLTRGAVRRRPRLRHPAQLVLVGIQLLALSYWPGDRTAAWFPAGLALLQLNLWLHSRHLVVEAWRLALVPVQVLAAMAAAPHAIWLLVFPAALLVCAAALVLLSARATAERVKRGAAQPYQTAWAELGLPVLDPRELRSRLVSASLLALLLGALVCTTYPMLVALPRPAFDPRRTRDASSDVERGSTQSTVTDPEGGARGEFFPGDLRPGGGIGDLSYETVMTVDARRANAQDRGPQNVGPLYLRALCLDTFTETGLRSNPRGKLNLLQDSDDGLPDGWIELEAPTAATELVLEVRQNALRIPSSEEIVLFAAQPALGLRMPAVRHDPDRLLALPAGMDVSEVRFGLRVGAHRPKLEELVGARATHPQARFVQLPPRTPDRDWVANRARELTRGAGDDLERVARVLEHFHQDYDYSTRTRDVPGLEGIVDFMRREQGHCTSFAAAAVLLLRTLDLPARVATGFLAADVSSQTGRYIVTRANGHAWIEVYFEGAGWQTFEPTPSGRRMAALRAAAAGEDNGLASWFKELRADLGAWARSGAEELYLGPIGQTLADCPRAARVSLERRPWLAVAFLSPLALWILLRKGRPGRASVVPGGASRRERSLVRDLLAALARRGPRRPPHLTLHEYAAVAALGKEEPGEGLRDELQAVVTLMERASFGDRPLERGETERVQKLTRRLRVPG
jgi:hypothetical protein